MRQYPLHRIRLLLAASALLFLWLGPIAALADMQEYADPETGEIKSFDPNEQLELHVVNHSKHRADVYWDDGQYGISVVTVEADGGKGGINASQGHKFFVTRHGVRETLHDPATDDKFTYVASHPDQILVIPEDASPPASKCQDRFSICSKEAGRGSCSTSPGWMIVHCCKSCDEELGASRLLDASVRCTKENLNMTAPAVGPGDLDRLFESWATEDKFGEYEPKVWSSPGGKYGGMDGPWVMTFDKVSFCPGGDGGRSCHALICLLSFVI